MPSERKEIHVLSCLNEYIKAPLRKKTEKLSVLNYDLYSTRKISEELLKIIAQEKGNITLFEEFYNGR